MSEEPFVLVAYDGSPDAEIGLSWAIDTARLTGTRIKVVVAVDSPLRPAAPVLEQERRWIDDVMTSARSKVNEAGVSADVVLEYGEPLPVLLRACEGAKLVVVGSRGHSLWDAPWIGSVSHHLAGRPTCPVAVVRRTHNQAARRILVGIDGSPASVRALSEAARRASLTGEEVLAVHAYQHHSFASGGWIGIQAIDVSTEAEDAAERLAAEMVAGVAVDFPDVKLRSSAVLGRAGRVLSGLADAASLVVVGSRGRTPVQELVLGSVSAELLHKAECPVLVVR